MIKAVFFDIDNTLLSFDEYVKQCMEEGFARFGLRRYEPWMFDVFTRENNALWRALEHGEITFEKIKAERWNRIFSALGICFDGTVFEALFRAGLDQSAIPVPGSVQALKELYGRFALCAASNGPLTQQLDRLQAAGMSDYFEHCFISEDIGASKPSAAFFTACFERLNADRQERIMPGETLMVGDSLTSDIAGGKAAGTLTCLYAPSGTLPEGEIRPDHVIRSLSELKDLPILKK